MAQSPLKKILIIAGLMLVLVAPLLMIQAKINERQQRAAMVSQEVSRQYAGEQTVSGPVIMVPQVRRHEVAYQDQESGERRTRGEFRHELASQVPDTLTIDFNYAYNPLCARSEHYNCPLVDFTIPAAIRAGEQYAYDEPH